MRCIGLSSNITALKMLLDFSTHIFNFQNALTTGSIKWTYWKKLHTYNLCKCIITLLYCQPCLCLLGFFNKTHSLVVFVWLTCIAFIFQKIIFYLYCLIQTILQKLSAVLKSYYPAHNFIVLLEIITNSYIVPESLFERWPKKRKSHVTNYHLLGE